MQGDGRIHNTCSLRMEIAFVMAEAAPQPVAPFSHAVRAGAFLFVTGQMPTLPGRGLEMIEGDCARQTAQVMDNLAGVLRSQGLGLKRVVMARVYLTHFQRDYAAMNAVYESYFNPARKPARTCIGVTGLALDALVEIDLVAAFRDVAGEDTG